MLVMMASAEESVLSSIQATDAGPPAPAVTLSSADGSDFLSVATARTTGDKPAASAAVVDAMVFCPCPAVDGDPASSCSTRTEYGPLPVNMAICAINQPTFQNKSFSSNPSWI